MIDSAQKIDIDLSAFNEEQKRALQALATSIKRNDDAIINSLGSNILTQGGGVAFLPTLSAPATPASNTLYTSNVPKAWVFFVVGGGVITAQTGFNCTVARTGAGLFTLTFPTALADANYASAGFAHTAGTYLIYAEQIGGTRTTTTLQIVTVTTAIAGADPVRCSVIVLGN